MPKVNLYARPLPTEVDGSSTRLTVGWSKDHGGVQISVTHLRDGADRNREYGDDGEPNWEGWFMDLERYNINELIRTLRQARDTAYGRDE